MTVKTADARNKAAHEGHTYYFCSPRCLAKFTAEPLRYLKPAAAPAAAGRRPGTIYTCPMHPEIRQVGPGSCPICGMALEPAEASLEDRARTRSSSDMTRRFVGRLGARRAGPGARHGRPSVRHRRAARRRGMTNWLQLVLATPVVLWAGWPFFVRGAHRWRGARSTCSP